MAESRRKENSMDKKSLSDAIEMFHDQIMHEILDAPIDETSREYLLERLHETYDMVKATYIS